MMLLDCNDNLGAYVSVSYLTKCHAMIPHLIIVDGSNPRNKGNPSVLKCARAKQICY